MNRNPFWKTKTLDEMNNQEWESLCDGCGQCCLHKLKDIDSNQTALTNVSCKYLDLNTCQCTDYKNRSTNVPDCVELTAQNAGELEWMPQTCAYRLLAEGKSLYWWHPLISGNNNTVKEAGISIENKAISEEFIEDLEDHIVNWLNNKNSPGAPPLKKKKP